MSQMAIGIKLLGTALKSYNDNISGIELDKVTAANEVLGKISEVDQSLKDVSLGELIGIFSGKKRSLSSFANDIVTLGTALGNYATNIGGISLGNVITANLVIDKIKSLEDSFKKVTWDDVFGFLKGKRESIASFGGDMEVLGQAISKYADSTSGLNQEKLGLANDVIDVVSALNTKLPVTGGFWKLITGQKKLGEFASNMSTLGDGVAGYADKVSGATFSNNVTDSMDVVDRLADVFAKLDKTGGMGAWFSGDKDLSALSKGLSTVGTNMIAFQTNISKLDYDKVSDGISILERIGAIQASINWKTTKTNGLKEIAGAVKEAFETLAKASIGSVSVDGKSTGILTGVSELGKLVVTEIGSGITDAANKPNEDGSPTKAMTLLIAGLSTTGFDAVINSGQFTLIGNRIDKELGEGIKAKESIPKSHFARTVNHTASNVTGNSYFLDKFISAGENLTRGFAQGIRNKEWVAIASFVRVVNQAYRAGLNAARIHSPSKMTEWMGEMLDMGLVQGLEGYSYRVDTASENVVNSALTSAQIGLKAISSVIENDIDTTPTIRPVLDLTDIQNGASGIGGLFGSQSIGVSSSSMASSIARRSSDNASVAVENPTADLSGSIVALNERINTLDESIRGMKVILDTGAVVGGIGSEMDRYLGKAKLRKNKR